MTNTHVLTLRVDAPSHFTVERVQQLVAILIDVGMADASATVEDAGNFGPDVEYAEQTCELSITGPFLLGGM